MRVCRLFCPCFLQHLFDRIFQNFFILKSNALGKNFSILEKNDRRDRHNSVAGSNIRYIRSAMLEILEMDYLRTARAKGIGHFLVINKHALRNALLPIVTVIGMQIPTLFGGAVIIEQIFSWPGLGMITMTAITGRDYPVVMGVCLLSAVVVQAANLLTDLVYGLVDPTIKY